MRDHESGVFFSGTEPSFMAACCPGSMPIAEVEGVANQRASPQELCVIGSGPDFRDGRPNPGPRDPDERNA